ncbi:C-C motif chemokine 4-like isoform 2-T2 [Sarcophilus harrisii]
MVWANHIHTILVSFGNYNLLRTLGSWRRTRVDNQGLKVLPCPLGIMKVSVAALSILMVMAFSCLISCAPMGSDPPTSSCFFYVSRQIQRKNVIGYYETSTLCSQPAVVFLTKRGWQVCANPTDAWVQSYVEDLELN